MAVTPTPPNANLGRSTKPEPLKFDPNTIGGTGLRQTGGFIHEEFLKDLRGEHGMRKFREMAENDFVCGAILFAINLLIRGVEWEIQPVDASVEGEEAAEFVRGLLFEDMNTPFDTFIDEACTMFTYGHAPMEITWKKRVAGEDEIGLPLSKFDDGMIGIRSIQLRAQETVINWDIDLNTGAILGFWQQTYDRPQVYIPMAKALLFRTTALKNNPLGRSILRSAYRPWYFKTRMEEIEAIGVERDLAGLPMMRIPAQFMAQDATPQDKAIFAAYQKLVTNVRRDQQEGVILPSTKDKEGHYLFDFSLLSTAGSRSFDTNKVLTRYDTAIATAVLADFLFLGQKGVGSFALSDGKIELFSAAIQSYLEKGFAPPINDVIARVWHLNALDPALMPKAVPGKIEEAALGEVAALITSMVGAGAMMFPDPNLENHLRRRAGLPPAPEEGIQAPEAPDGENDVDEPDEEAET